MSKYNTCAECNKELGWRKKKYCSKECVNANARKRYRVKNNISSRKCQFCNRCFEPNKNGAKIKYCSEDCFKEMRRENNRERFRLENGLYEKYGNKRVCLMCGNEIEGRNLKAVYCSENCKSTYFDRENGHVPIEEHLLKVNGQKKKRLESVKLDKARKDLLNSIKSIIAKEIKIQKEREKIEALTRECEECGEVFYNPHPLNKTCSPRCSKRRSNRMMKLYESKRINERNLVDKDISLKRLYKRDKGVCYLCNSMCDSKDISITDEGYYIVRPTYPSIDHVEPLSKGGKHAWNNVKLAHHYCNTLKGDSI